MLEKIPNKVKIQLVNIPLIITLLTGCNSFVVAKDKNEETTKAKSCYYELESEKDSNNIHHLNIYI